MYDKGMFIETINYILWYRKISIRNGMDLHEKVERSQGVESEYFKLDVFRRQAKFKHRGCQKNMERSYSLKRKPSGGHGRQARTMGTTDAHGPSLT